MRNIWKTLLLLASHSRFRYYIRQGSGADGALPTFFPAKLMAEREM